MNLTTSKHRDTPDATACTIVVKIHPSGEIRRSAEHEWLHVAIDRAASAISADIKQEMLQVNHTPAAVLGARAMVA